MPSSPLRSVHRPLLLGFALLVVGVGCARPTRVEPELASSSTDSGYATRFPELIQQTLATLDWQEGRVKETAAEFSHYPGELKDPPWATVAAIYRQADATGRSASYVERREELASVETFFEDEKGPLERKVSGAAQWVAKQKGCTAEVGTQAGYALGEGVKERMEARLHERSPAQAAVLEQSDELGAANVEPLKKQVDAISEASYLVFVAMVREKQTLRRQLAEAENVRQTLDHSVQTERAVAGSPSASKSRKAAAEARAKSAEQARAALDDKLEKAKQAEAAIEDRIAAAQKVEQDALTALLAAVDAKTKK